MLLYGSRLLDMSGPPPRKGWMVIDGDLIVEVGEGSKPEGIACDLAINAGHRTILPGLIDCHVHVVGLGQGLRDPDAGPRLIARHTVDAVVGLDAVVRSGVTTVRDCGYPHHGIFTIRESADAGQVLAPRMRLAGRAIAASGGHGATLGVQVDGADAVRRAVRLEAKAGADWLKVMITGGTATPGEEVTDVQFTVEEVAAAVDEAHRRGKRVCAHVSNLAGARVALQAGVDSLEHGIVLDDEAIAQMLDAGTWLVSTLSCTKIEGEAAPDSGIPDFIRRKAAAIYRQQMASFQRAAAAGVRIVAGTDAATPYLALGGKALAAELMLMVQLGMGTAKALAAATCDAADMLGLGDVLGTLTPGRWADVLIIDGDPLEDVGAVGRPWLVISRGRVIAGPPELLAPRGT